MNKWYLTMNSWFQKYILSNSFICIEFVEFILREPKLMFRLVQIYNTYLYISILFFESNGISMAIKIWVKLLKFCIISQDFQINIINANVIVCLLEFRSSINSTNHFDY